MQHSVRHTRSPQNELPLEEPQMGVRSKQGTMTRRAMEHKEHKYRPRGTLRGRIPELKDN